MQTALAPVPSTDDTLLHAVSQRMWDIIGLHSFDLAQTPVLKQAIDHHISSGGQFIRARLGYQASLALGLSVADSLTLAATVEFVHNASLVHDDLQDRDRLRRGQSSVWTAFGDDVAICSGDLLLSMAYQALSQFSKSEYLPRLISIVHSKIALAIAGQCADLHARSTQVQTLSEYERIVTGKSGAFLSLPLELALEAASMHGHVPTARQVGQSLALGYQIVDDLDDRDADRACDDKPHSLNICFVLQTAGNPDDYQEKARAIGWQHLTQALNLARQLPNGAGDGVSDLAQCLIQRL